MEKLKRMRPYAIFTSVMRCMIAACGLAFTLPFFCHTHVFTRNELLEISNALFWFLILSTAFYELTIGQSWFYEKGRVVETGPIGLATLSQKDNSDKDVADYNKRISAVHEAGHALMAYLLKIESYDVHMSYISPHVVTVEKLADAEGVKKRILIKYAGAVAEELLLGKFYEGCMGSQESDFSKATEYIKEYIVMTNDNVSKSLLDEELSAEIIQLSKEFYAEATNILSEDIDKLRLLSDELLDKEKMTKKEIDELLDNYPYRKDDET